MKFVPKQLKQTAEISRGAVDRSTVIKNVASVILFFLLCYLLLGWLGLLIGSFIPDTWEKKISGGLIMELGAADLDNTNSALERSQEILDRLTEGESLRALNYKLFLLSLGMPNAVAVPGGGIGVTPELLEQVKSDEGLAFVIAHELGHHQYRHILGKMGRGLTFSVAGALLLNSESFTPINTSIRLAETKFSRSQEQEADEFAIRLVSEKFGASTNSLEFFNIILQEQPDPVWQKYLRSHPMTENRIKHLQRLHENSGSK